MSSCAELPLFSVLKRVCSWWKPGLRGFLGRRQISWKQGKEVVLIKLKITKVKDIYGNIPVVL